MLCAGRSTILRTCLRAPNCPCASKSPYLSTASPQICTEIRKRMRGRTSARTEQRSARRRASKWLPRKSGRQRAPPSAANRHASAHAAYFSVSDSTRRIPARGSPERPGGNRLAQTRVARLCHRPRAEKTFSARSNSCSSQDSWVWHHVRGGARSEERGARNEERGTRNEERGTRSEAGERKRRCL